MVNASQLELLAQYELRTSHLTFFVKIYDRECAHTHTQLGGGAGGENPQTDSR